ncbi:M13 family metallopeptidase [Rhizomicrobium electricum]|uniref:M13 family metallopeptidase n=1 Tax=Rhizomicrobium electricum TaxID=480070 RepID=A0ABP3QAH5_9PROT|nr:M13 family metallopeptidase [Rhizomicrobium electricum]NIJ50720.1 putative metalloendopeptidase [Rhizomicrobium electricum]
MRRIYAVSLAVCATVAAVAASVPSGIDLAGIDKAVAPGDDFFAYGNGAWLKKTAIPADRSSFGTFDQLLEKTSAEVRDLIQTAAKTNPKPGSDAQKVGDYYASFMDEAGIEAKGLTPLKPEFDRIAAIKDTKSLSAYLGAMLRADVDPLNATNLYTDHIFGIWVNQAFEQPGRNVPYILQGGLGMPDREYYLSKSPKMAAIRTKYQAHIAAVLKLAGIADADAKAARIMALETKIASAHTSRADSEDVLKANNPWNRGSFAKRAPGMDWNAYFAAAGLSDQADFIVWQPGAVTGTAALVSNQPVGVWKEYLAYQLIEHYSGVLPKAFVNESFAFYGTVLNGTPKIRDRWKRAISATNGALGEPVGKLYVARYFPPAAKAKIEGMVKELIAAYRARINRLAWMSPATKQKALAKLATLKVGVGYPDKWRDYSSLKIVRGDAFGNLQRSEQFEYRYALAKLHRPVDRGEWAMDPQTVNAVNLPLVNALNFPAAILQPPFFDPKADDALNYGSIGATIGHEISHSFDDQGSQFDAQGKLNNWWTPADLAHFRAAAAKLVKQYDGYRPFADLAVNGKQTLGENIADVAGLSATYDAYILSLHGKPAPVLDGLSGDQRFFLAYSQSWRDKTREAALRQQILTDGHAPAEYRADTVRNLDAWYKAFAVKPGQKLFLKPEDRVQVW